MNHNFEQNSLKGVKAPKLCYTAGGMLLHRSKVLLVKHKKLGIWLNPGGHIDEGELPHEAAQREFFEETGVRVRALDAFRLPGIGKSFSLIDLAQKNPISYKSSLVPKSKITAEMLGGFPYNSNLGFQPNPISTNLHWVNEESYELRIKSNNPDKRYPTKVWKRGCEQHLGFFYLLEAVDGVDFYQNEEETDGIAWFDPDELDELDTRENIRKEIKLGFSLMNSRG
jgi:8-oxo-dGTP pyrophosphatase MutT (NUDIX family)